MYGEGNWLTEVRLEPECVCVCLSRLVLCAKCVVIALCGLWTVWSAERQHRVEELQSTFAVIKSKAESRQSDVEQTLVVAEKFWDDLNGMLATLKELQDTMASADPPALEPETIRDQQDVLEVSLYVMAGSVQ